MSDKKPRAIDATNPDNAGASRDEESARLEVCTAEEKRLGVRAELKLAQAKIEEAEGVSRDLFNKWWTLRAARLQANVVKAHQERAA
jgi:hypothetical protein